jgi:Flp pilus assembly protein protease CpaA
MLWAGSRDGLSFLVAMTLIGGALAAFLLIAGRAIMSWPSLRRYIPSRRFKNWAVRGIFPYGIAICSAGLLFMPVFFRGD